MYFIYKSFNDFSYFYSHDKNTFINFLFHSIILSLYSPSLLFFFLLSPPTQTLISLYRPPSFPPPSVVPASSNSNLLLQPPLCRSAPSVAPPISQASPHLLPFFRLNPSNREPCHLHLTATACNLPFDKPLPCISLKPSTTPSCNHF